MMRFLPPAGSPLTMTQILDSVRYATPLDGQASECLRAVAARLKVKHVFGLSSGRAALWLALKALHRLHPDRDVVAVPAYTCFSVPAAIVRAGLRMYPVEIDPHTLDFDSDQLVCLPREKLLCIVPGNLFGFPNDIPAVRRAAQAAGAYVIDDAAQAFGSMRDGKLAGTLGDIGIYSLGRGKSVGTVGGGLLVTDSDEIAATIQSEEKNLPAPGTAAGGKLLLKMFSYSLLLHPRLFWIPNSLPFLKLGTTEFEPSFPAQRMHPFSLALLKRLLDDLDGVNQVRRGNAEVIQRALHGSRNFELPNAGTSSQPTLGRLPLVARDQATRDLAVSRLRGIGIGATAFYPSAICDIPGIEEHMSDRNFHRVRAEELSRRLLTLPVHPFVKPRDLERMAEVLNSL
jgi:perosamine synthetase